MTEADRRERALQAYVEGEIDREELRQILAEAGEAHEPEDDLAAYRAVWAGLEREPATRLPADFARRTARSALAAREGASSVQPAAVPDWRIGALPAALSVASVLAALIVGVLLLPAAGLEVEGLVARLVRAGASVPPPLWGAAGSAAVLYAADRMWTRNFGRTGPVG